MLPHSIELGDPTRPSSDPLLATPQDLRLLANEDYATNPMWPEGRVYFAPGPADPATVFNQVAKDLLACLTQ